MDNYIVCDACGGREDERKLYNGYSYGYDFLCRKHYEQIRLYGKFLEHVNESQKDSSTIEIIDGTIFIALKNKRYEKIGESMVDVDMQDIIKDKRWSLNSQGYAVSHLDGKLIFLHHLVMEAENKEGLVIDHKDKNKLNNRKENLRLIEKQKNHINHNGYSNNKSGFTGVTLDKGRNKWKALIHIEGKQKLIGRFENIEDAVIARLNAELKYYGEEFAPQRHLFEKFKIKD